METNAIFELDECRKPMRIVSLDATYSDFNYECTKQRCFALALVSIKEINGKQMYKLKKINYK